MAPRLVARAACLVLAASTLACPGTLDDPERFLAAESVEAGIDPGTGDGEPPVESGACPDIPALFATTCASPVCHSAGNKAQGLDLQSAGVGARLVGAQATEGSGLLIDPSAPEQSVLYLKLTAQPPFGARMPLGQTPLDGATVACVLAWISEQRSNTDGEGGAPTPDAEGGTDGGGE